MRVRGSGRVPRHAARMDVDAQLVTDGEHRVGGHEIHVDRQRKLPEPAACAYG